MLQSSLAKQKRGISLWKLWRQWDQIIWKSWLRPSMNAGLTGMRTRANAQALTQVGCMTVSLMSYSTGKTISIGSSLWFMSWVTVRILTCLALTNLMFTVIIRFSWLRLPQLLMKISWRTTSWRNIKILKSVSMSSTTSWMELRERSSVKPNLRNSSTSCTKQMQKGHH